MRHSQLELCHSESQPLVLEEWGAGSYLCPPGSLIFHPAANPQPPLAATDLRRTIQEALRQLWEQKGLEVGSSLALVLALPSSFKAERKLGNSLGCYRDSLRIIGSLLAEYRPKELLIIVAGGPIVAISAKELEELVRPLFGQQAYLIRCLPWDACELSAFQELAKDHSKHGLVATSLPKDLLEAQAIFQLRSTDEGVFPLESDLIFGLSSAETLEEALRHSNYSVELLSQHLEKVGQQLLALLPVLQLDLSVAPSTRTSGIANKLHSFYEKLPFTEQPYRLLHRAKAQLLQETVEEKSYAIRSFDSGGITIPRSVSSLAYRLDSEADPLEVLYRLLSRSVRRFRESDCLSDDVELIIVHPLSDHYENPSRLAARSFFEILLPQIISVESPAMISSTSGPLEAWLSDPALVQIYCSGDGPLPIWALIQWGLCREELSRFGHCYQVAADNEYIPQSFGINTARNFGDAVRLCSLGQREASQLLVVLDSKRCLPSLKNRVPQSAVSSVLQSQRCLGEDRHEHHS